MTHARIAARPMQSFPAMISPRLPQPRLATQPPVRFCVECKKPIEDLAHRTVCAVCIAASHDVPAHTD
jgi:hypothetical protein